MGLHAAAGGWVAVGFPASPGRMLGATAMVLHTCPPCPSGTTVVCLHSLKAAPTDAWQLCTNIHSLVPHSARRR